MPSGLNQYDRSAGLQARVRHRLVPALKAPALDGAVRLRIGLNRVVYQQEIGTAAGKRTASAHRVVGAARHQIEPMGRAAVRRELAARENRRLERISDEVAHAPAEVERQLLAIAGRDYRAVRV